MKLASVVMTTIVLSYGTVVTAQNHVTVGGYPACFSEQWFDDAIKFLVNKDHASLQAYIDSKKCVILKDGLPVTIVEYPGLFGGVTVAVFQGVRFWTNREAIK